MCAECSTRLSFSLTECDLCPLVLGVLVYRFYLLDKVAIAHARTPHTFTVR